MVEVISVMAIIGILAVFAAPRMLDPTGFASRGFYDQVRSLISYAQKIAIAQRRSTAQPVYVVVAATTIRVCNNPSCTSLVLKPEDGSPLALTTPTGVTLSPATTFSFTGSGAASPGVTLSVLSTGVGDFTRTFVVEAQTGYVHP